MLLDPKYGKYVIAFLKEKRSELDLKQLSDIANNELKYNLEQDLQQEALLFLYLIREIQLEITGDNIKQALRSSDDFSVIIALDIWKNRNDLVKRSRWEAKLINQERKALAKELEKENYANGRWLLLHEIEMHKLFPREEYKPVDRDDFFKLLLKENVSFYIA